jgi:hypothetical protein
MLFLVTGAELGGTVAISRVTMEDGTEHSLLDHLRDGHQKGTRGFTEEYLANLHRILHQRHHEPEPEHTHPGTGEPAEPAEPRGPGDPAQP